MMLFNKGFSPTSTLKVAHGGEKKTEMSVYDLWKKVVRDVALGNAEFDGKDSILLSGGDPYVIGDSNNPSLVNKLKRIGLADASEVMEISTTNKKTLEVAPDFEFFVYGGGRENAKNLIPERHILIQSSGRGIDIVSVSKRHLGMQTMWIETSSYSFDLDGFRAFYFE